MSYATVSDMTLSFGDQTIVDLSDREGTGSVDVAVVERALVEASADMDTYFAVRYAVPVVAQTDHLRAVCCDIARYRLASDRVNDEVQQRYDSAQRWLREVAAGRAVLVGAVAPAEGAAAAQRVEVVPGRRIFSGGIW